jgi:hypothetical protein
VWCWERYQQELRCRQGLELTCLTSRPCRAHSGHSRVQG